MNKIIATETELKFSAAYLTLPPILERRESKMIVCLGEKMVCAVVSGDPSQADHAEQRRGDKVLLDDVGEDDPWDERSGLWAFTSTSFETKDGVWKATVDFNW